MQSLSDKFENYCFIKRILSLKEAYVWGVFALTDTSLTFTSPHRLFDACSPHLAQNWTF